MPLQLALCKADLQTGMSGFSLLTSSTEKSSLFYEASLFQNAGSSRENVPMQ